jgi:enoyl-CoA hydratase
MESSFVSVDLRDQIALITMDDGKANALGHDMLAGLEAAFDRAEAEAKAVVLGGRAGRFSAGFDLKVMMSGPDNAMKLVARGGELMLRLYELPLPLVIACSGHALAGGVLLAATGDTRIGARGEFQLGLNEVRMGIPVPILAHELARDRLRKSELIPATVQAKIYDPDAAVHAGWLDRAVEPAELAEAAFAEATSLAALPGVAYQVTKQSVRRDTIQRIRSQMEANIGQLTSALSGAR